MIGLAMSFWCQWGKWTQIEKSDSRETGHEAAAVIQESGRQVFIWDDGGENWEAGRFGDISEYLLMYWFMGV